MFTFLNPCCCSCVQMINGALYAMASPYQDVAVFTSFLFRKVSITFESLCSLFCGLIKSRVLMTSLFFLTLQLLERGLGHANVKNWARKLMWSRRKSTFEQRLLLIPINIGNVRNHVVD
jgi:hypothetical protein